MSHFVTGTPTTEWGLCFRIHCAANAAGVLSCARALHDGPTAAKWRDICLEPAILWAVRGALRRSVVVFAVGAVTACGAFSSTQSGPADAAPDALDGAASDRAVSDDAGPIDDATADAAASRLCGRGKHLFCDDFELSRIPADFGPWSSVRRSGAGQLEVLDAAACGGSRCLRAFSSGLPGTAMLRVDLPLQPTLCRFRIKVSAPDAGATAKVLVVSAVTAIRASESQLELVGSSASVPLGPTPSGWTEVVLGLQSSNLVSVQANITGGAPGGLNPTLSEPVVLEVGVETASTVAWSVLIDDFFCDKL